MVNTKSTVALTFLSALVAVLMCGTLVAQDRCGTVEVLEKKRNKLSLRESDEQFEQWFCLKSKDASIEQAAEQIKNAVLELRDMKNMRAITDALVKVNSIENQADDIFDLSIDRLFETEPDAKEVIKMREIYQAMEIATDKCEDAGNVIESIIVKYA